MKTAQQSFLKNTVKAYLQMKVAKSGFSPVLLESERELAARFSFARQTVHAAVMELLEEGWCIQLPGKRGVFSNPERAIPENRNIGFLSGNLYSSTLYSMPVMSGICTGFNNLCTFLRFTRLYSTDFEGMVRELELLDYDGLLFDCGREEDVTPLVRRLIGDGIPLVVFTSQTSLAKFDLPEENYEPFEYGLSLKRRVGTVLKQGYRNPFMSSCSDSYFTLFNRYSRGLLKPENFNVDVGTLASQLCTALETSHPDLLIIDGGPARYRILLQVLESYSGKIPDLMMDRQAEFCHPGIASRYHVQFMDDTEQEFERGLRIARKLDSLMKRRNHNGNNEILKK